MEEAASGTALRGRAFPGFVAAVAEHAGLSGLWTAFLVAASALLDGVGLLLLVPLLGAITGSGQGWIQDAAGRLFAQAGISDQQARLWLLLALFLLLSALRGFANQRRDLRLAALQASFGEAERNRLVAALAGAPWSRLVALRHAEVSTLLSSEVQRLSGACSYLIQGSVQIVLLSVQAFVALLLSPMLAAIAIVMLLIGTLSISVRHRRIHGLGEGFVHANQAMMANAAALLGGLKSARAQNTQHAFVAEFQAMQAVLRSHQLAFAGHQAAGRMTYSVVSASLAVALVGIGTTLLTIQPAILLTILVVFARMGPPAQQLYQNAQALIFTMPAFEAIRRAERAILPPASQAHARPVRPPKGPVELSRVTYVHPGGGGVRSADLVLRPGSFVGVRGPSGAGKTTLADVIVGLLEPQSGSVQVGGKKLRGGLRDGWRECISYVTQDGFLFHDSVRRNLLWGTDRCTDDEIAGALELVGADAMIARLHHGLETIVGERGAVLSGGERQRLILARAILRRPRLLVLDEATSAIDAEGEAVVLGGLKRLPERPSILMISHREESLENCDWVIRVDNGEVRIER